MSHNPRLKTKARGIAASGARRKENILVISNERVDPRSAGATEMAIADIIDEGSESDATTTPHMQHHGECDKRLGFHKRQPLRQRRQPANDRLERQGCVDAMVSTMEWRRMVLQSQEESQAAKHREERQRARLEAEIEQIRLHYHEQEKVLESEIVRLEGRYGWAVAQLAGEKRKDEVDGCFVGVDVEGWGEPEVRSDYQPTECGSSRCGSVVPDSDLELGRQGLGKEFPGRSLQAVAGQSCTEDNRRRQKTHAQRH